MYILKLYLEFMKENKGTMFANLLLILFNYPFEIIILSYLSSQIFVNLNNIGQNWDKLLKLMVIFVMCYMILEVSISLKDYNDSNTIPKFESFVRNKIISQVFQKNEINCHNVNLGELIQRLLKIPPSMSDVYERCNKYIIPFFLTIAMVVGYLSYINLHLGLIALAAFVVYICIFIYIGKNQLSISKKREKDETMLYEDIDDTLGNVFTIFSLNQLNFEKMRLDQNSKIFNEIFEKELNDSAKLKFITSSLNISLFVILVSSILYYFKKGKLNNATTISLITLVIFLVKHIRGLARRVSEGLIFMGNLKESEDYLTQLNSETAIDGTKVNFYKNGHINFNNVCFRYEGSKTDSLKNVTFNIRPKEHVIIVGHSGSGKSTILKLLTGFYEPYKGDVNIDNVKLSDAKKDYLRKHITYISQSTRLFNRPIIDNIIYGTKYTREQAISIIKDLDISQVLSSKDLFQLAGKFGDNLSGGQKQIVQMLRCYLLDNETVLLDEPTSAIDPHYKKYVIEIIKHIMKTKQIIMVTHDWSIVSMFDKVIYINKGQIKYNGSPTKFDHRIIEQHGGNCCRSNLINY